MNARVDQTSWAGLPALALQDEVVSLLVVPDLGGRVVSLLDRRSGRQWLLEGDPPAADTLTSWAAEDAVFDGRASFGWDECVPTVAPCPDPIEPHSPPLRDHGDVWGRPGLVAKADAESTIELAWAGSHWPYVFRRRLSLPGGAVVLAEYAITSMATHPLAILWSIHPVLHLEPGTRIDLPGVSGARLGWTRGLALAPGSDLPWPVVRGADGQARDLSIVRNGEGWAAKLYASPPGAARAVSPDGSALELFWDRDQIPALGIWLSSGGWPVGGPPVDQVALEPTTSPDDDLASALVHDRALRIEPGDTRSWWVRFVLRSPARGR